MGKERNLDIFPLFGAMDRHDSGWLSRQSDEARKEFTPLTVMRWATGVSGGAEAAYTLWAINQRVNLHLFDLSHDKDLSFRLLVSCGTGRRLQRKWLSAKPARHASNAAYLLLAEHHPHASGDELRMLMALYTRQDFAEFANESGKTKDEVKACLQAYDKALG